MFKKNKTSLNIFLFYGVNIPHFVSLPGRKILDEIINISFTKVFVSYESFVSLLGQKILDEIINISFTKVLKVRA